MPTGKNNENIASRPNSSTRDVYERAGSNEHNDYKISGTEKERSSEETDELDNIEDHNGDEGE